MIQENTNVYRVKRGSHVRREGGIRVEYKEGDTFVPTNAEIASFRDKLELYKTVTAPVEKEHDRVLRDAELIEKVLSNNSDDFVFVIKDGNKISKKELRKFVYEKVKELFPKEDKEEK